MNPHALSRRDVLTTALAASAAAACFLRDDALERVQAAEDKAAGRSPEDVAADESYWRDIQTAFAVDRSLINLNNGGVSPSPRLVMDAQRRHLEFANNSPARNMWTVQDPQVETVRAALARAFGCSPEEMAITRNSSESLQICIYGIDLKPGDEVLTTDQDYPRMINTWKQREKREGIVLKTVAVPAPVNEQGELLEAFAKNITPRTKVILCCHVVNITGQIFPVRDIVHLARSKGIPVIVDGAHAFAQFDFRQGDLDCDYYGVSLHKWLTAAIGAGFLFVRKERIADLWPLMAAPEPRGDNIRKYEEIGTHPAANRLAIAEALTLYNAIGPKRKEARLRYLRDRWARRLMQDKRVRLYARLEPQHSCAIGTFTIDGVDNARLHEYLWSKHRIFTVNVDHPQIKGLRITPNTYTTLDEIDTFCEAVEQVLAKGLPA